MVHHSVKTLSRRKGAGPTAVAVLACGVALLSGCGGSSPSTSHASASARRGVGESLRLDNCADWRHATSGERRNTVLQLRRFAGGPVGSSAGIQYGPVLDDDRAYRLFQRACAKRFARGFKLYKLYEHAAVFVGERSG